jgi:hypothetical protein
MPQCDLGRTAWFRLRFGLELGRSASFLMLHLLRLRFKRMSSVKYSSMPAFGTPSIVQQRIILVVVLAVIGASAWWQNAGDSSIYPVQKFSTTPLPEVVGKLNFTTAEAAWSSLKIDPQGNLQIDARTETALVDAIALMHDQPSDGASELASELVMARTGFLLEKQFGATASRQITELIPTLKNYKEIEQRWLEENISRDPTPYAELFQLQDELLGKTMAEKLFSEQRRLANVMLASQQIQNDTRLTQEEKDQALLELQKTPHEKGTSLE